MIGKDRYLRGVNWVMFAIATMVIIVCFLVSDTSGALLVLPALSPFGRASTLRGELVLDQGHRADNRLEKRKSFVAKP